MTRYTGTDDEREAIRRAMISEGVPEEDIFEEDIDFYMADGPLTLA